MMQDMQDGLGSSLISAPCVVEHGSDGCIDSTALATRPLAGEDQK
jgi:hypothetical protein